MLQDRHVQSVIEQMCKCSEQAMSEYLEVLYAMVTVGGIGTPVRRNQALVMKYIMRSFTQIAGDFSADRDARYLPTVQMGVGGANKNFKNTLTGVFNRGTGRGSQISMLVAVIVAVM